MSNFAKQLKEGVLTNNPIFVQLIGTCPTLATSTSLENGMGMGIAVTLVLMCSNFVISLLRKFIPSKVRIAAYIVIIAGFVTIVDLSLQAWFPELSASLGIFIPLIVVNCLLLARAEAFASKNKPIPALIDGLTMGIGFTVGISIISSVRELIGTGCIYGIPVFGASYAPIVMMILPAGGFLTLGILMGIFQYFMNKKEAK
ncbi:MAG: electron transport complex subunit E [Clostridia bacterium]|nr:electron transport complex subunit E [Clostridia bacterium]MBQ2326427.1 electron transport complex subunit E [Clostridia bacterium]